MDVDIFYLSVIRFLNLKMYIMVCINIWVYLGVNIIGNYIKLWKAIIG